MKVVVIGGGMAGLAAAHRLLELDSGTEVTVLEASPRVGGLVRSERTEGYVIEHGPDSILTEKPAAVRLADRLGLGPRMIATRSGPHGAYVVARGRLERVPEGFAMLAPMAPGPFLRSAVVSWRGKIRALAEPLKPGCPHEDESLASFVSRRFGAEVLERLAQPLVSGIYGADPARLSLGATMPRFLQAERDHGSVIRGLRRAAAKRVAAAKGAAAKGKGGGTATAPRAAGARYGLFASFDTGLEVLAEAIAERLGSRVRTDAQVVAIEREGTGWRVRVRGQRSIGADAVVVALPAWCAAELVGEVDGALAALLGSIRYGSSATVTLAWARDQIPHPLDGFGFVVPAVEGRAMLASTWASVKWPGRAPEGRELIRVFFGGPARDDVVLWSDEEMVARARHELRQLMGIEAAPELVRVDRYVRAMPRYEVGHLELVAQIEARTKAHAGLALAGNAYRGVGIPDAVRSGEEAAEGLLAG